MADNLNPHQFGDQLTLFNAPLGQPETTTLKGNPHARLYRMVMVPNHLTDPKAVMEHVSQPGSDRGHSRSMGIHWQHDLDIATDLSHQADRDEWGGFGSGGNHHPVIVEADHPGHKHVVDFTPTPHGGPPEGVVGGSPRNNRLTGYKKDWALIHDTVGPHDLGAAMLPEVPIRPGAPMQVHAVHFPDEESSTSGDFKRVPVKYKGQA